MPPLSPPTRRQVIRDLQDVQNELQSINAEIANIVRWLERLHRRHDLQANKALLEVTRRGAEHLMEPANRAAGVQSRLGATLARLYSEELPLDEDEPTPLPRERRA